MAISDKLKIWFRPERFKYVSRVLDPNSGCVFCDADKNGVGFEQLLLYSSEHSLVFLNKYPYNNGHVLVLPKRHEGEFTQLSDVEYRELHKTLRKSVDAVQKEFKPKAVNIGMNLGRAAGAGIPDHLHYHIVPRWDGDTNFFPVIAETKVVSMGMEEVYQRLLPYFQ